MESDDIDITVTTSQLTTLAIKIYHSENTLPANTVPSPDRQHNTIDFTFFLIF